MHAFYLTESDDDTVYTHGNSKQLQIVGPFTIWNNTVQLYR